MKQLLAFIILCICITACKKEITSSPNTDSYLGHVKAALNDSMGTAVVAQLDYSKAILSDVDSTDLHLVTIPFKNGGTAKFVLVQTNSEGNIQHGRIVTLQKTNAETAMVQRQYNGAITIQTLKKELLLQSEVVQGKILALHRRSTGTMNEQLTTAQLVQPSDNMLPEVIIMGYIPPNGGVSYSDWISLESMFGGDGGMPSNAYTPTSGSNGSSSYSGVYPSGGSSVSQVRPIHLEREYMYNIPGIDPVKMFRCFDNIPSNDATYKIRLCTDLPANTDPNGSTNASGVNAGHTFLVITKSNGNISVTQSFGFYPRTAPSWFDPLSPVASTLRDNGAQEINASIEMNLSEAEFTIIRKNAIVWSSNQYALADYNCTNYALDVFNSVRTNPITVKPYQVVLPGSADAYNAAANPNSISIDKSPQMLFSTLRQMKFENNPESAQIMIDQSSNYRAPISHGECN